MLYPSVDGASIYNGINNVKNWIVQYVSVLQEITSFYIKCVNIPILKIFELNYNWRKNMINIVQFLIRTLIIISASPFNFNATYTNLLSYRRFELYSMQVNVEIDFINAWRKWIFCLFFSKSENFLIWLEE